MRVRVRLFARQREIAKASRVDLELPDGATIDQAWTALVEIATRSWRRGGRTCGSRGTGPTRTRTSRWPTATSWPASRRWRAGQGRRPPGPIRPTAAPRPSPPGPLTRGSGGSRSPPTRSTTRALARLRAAVATRADGAVVTFEGRTRETPGTPAPGEEAEAARHAGASVRALEYEAYEAMALAVLGTIADEIEARFGVRRVGIVHRTGLVPLGEASVAVVVAAPHRGAAFDACRYAIDELKGRAPIWKAEQFADGSVWIGQPARSSAEGDPTGSR